MKRRIEIWIDVEVATNAEAEALRKRFEDQCWDYARRVLGLSRYVPQERIFIQANEVSLPLPSHGTREDYEAYIRSQRI